MENDVHAIVCVTRLLLQSRARCARVMFRGRPRKQRPAPGTPLRARYDHDLGTRRARTCLFGTVSFLLFFSIIPRRTYAPLIDVFGERGTMSIGDMVEARIAARELERMRAREMRKAARPASGLWWRSRSATRGLSGRAKEDEMGERESNVVADELNGQLPRATVSDEGTGALGARERSLLDALELRLGKVNDERDSIIYLMRKIRGESGARMSDGSPKQLTEDEINALAVRMELEQADSKWLLRKLGFGR